MSEAKKYIFLHVPKTAGTTITSMLPEQRAHNGPFPDEFNPINGFSQWRPPKTWPSLHKHTGKVIKEAGQELADIIEEKQYCRKLDHYTLEQRFETGLVPEEEFDKYFSFCFVRNPWDRVLSAIGHRYNEKAIHDSSKKQKILDMDPDFISSILTFFIKKISTLEKFYYMRDYHASDLWPGKKDIIGGFGNHLVPQHLYALDKKSMKKVDFVGRYENLENDFKVVANELGLETGVTLPRLNSKNSRRKGRHYTEFYTKETRDLVAEIYAEDIKMFGYKFGE